jgi:hypothetical protein
VVKDIAREIDRTMDASDCELRSRFNRDVLVDYPGLASCIPVKWVMRVEGRVTGRIGGSGQ